ncbi:hypothetical protein RBB50_009308 [Rhinocladiella similis]
MADLTHVDTFTKAEVAAQEDVEDISQTDAGFDKQATRKLLRKIDLAIIPLVTILYLLSFLDRANIGNARLAGLEEDLGMKGLDTTSPSLPSTPYTSSLKYLPI